MLIDMHTHIFPDALAPRVIPHMAQIANTVPATDGTLAGQLDSMRQNGVDFAVVLPVVTAPRQFDSINAFALQINRTQKTLLSFGGIHPDCEDVPGKLAWLKEQGFLGIKLHPDYQNHMVDDDAMTALVRRAVALGLYVVIHAGLDPVSPELIHAPAQACRRLIDAVGESGAPHIILAHMGANAGYDEAEKYLVGQNVLLDTAHVADKISAEQLCRMICAHGADKILFASDAPWGQVGAFAERIRSLPLQQEQIAQICYRNAAQILGIGCAEAK